MLMPIVKSFIEWKQKKNLYDESKREEVMFDYIYITYKIYLTNIVKIARLSL